MGLYGRRGILLIIETYKLLGVFAIGVNEETALNAAIPPKNGRTWPAFPTHSNSKNALSV
jgi:hypothetical protein